MTFLDDLIDSLEDGAVFGVRQAAQALDDHASEVDDPVEAFVLRSTAELVRIHGVAGVGLARETFQGLLDGKNLDPAKVRQLPLHERAPLIAAATRKEINARKVGDEAITAVGAFFGKLVAGFASGAIRAA